MTKDIKLKATKRKEVGKSVNNLREAGLLPAVMYGHNLENVNISVKETDFAKTYQEAGESTLIDLVLDEKPVKVIIQDVQLDPVKGGFIHADFHMINMKEKMTAYIPLKFTGSADAIKTYGGILVTAKDEVEVSCLPQDLVSEIEVDLTPLMNIDDAIHISDLKVPEGVTLKDDPQDMVANIVAPAAEEEEPVVAPVEGAEGAAAAPATEEGATAESAQEKTEEKK